MPRSVLEFSGITWVCAGIMTMVLRLRITLSDLRFRADMLRTGIDVSKEGPLCANRRYHSSIAGAGQCRRVPGLVNFRRGEITQVDNQAGWIRGRWSGQT
jgi:hypothetical protein